jgi:lipase chaperone LimK
LRDTDVDGGFSVGPAGHLAPNPDALALFDYFLAASGEEPLPQIVERIIAEIRQRLTDPAASEAIALLDQYLAYRTEIRELTSHSEPPHDLERRLQWLRELRNQHFGANTAAQLFGEQEAITLVDLERRRVAADPSLSDAERDQRLAALDDRLPPRVAEARHNARAPARAQREVAALRANGADDATVFAAREHSFGHDAATRLAELDERRRQWDARLSNYRSERDALVSESNAVDTAQRSAEIDALRAQHFSEPEILRVRMLDDAEARNRN